MAKKRTKQDEEAPMGLNYQPEDDQELMGLNASLDTEESELAGLNWADATNEGVYIPPAHALRDPRKDKDPLEGEDLGLTEGHFLTHREVTPEDLDVHEEIDQDSRLASNTRTVNEYESVFDNGPSTTEKPKIDVVDSVKHSKPALRLMKAKQLLRNCHSQDNKEQNNAFHVLRTMGFDLDFIKEVKSNKKAYDDDALLELVGEQF